MPRLRPDRFLRTSDHKQVESDSRDLRQDIYANQISWSIPFGKYQGKPIVAVPLDYLQYIRRTSNNMHTVRRCAEEVDRRQRIHR